MKKYVLCLSVLLLMVSFPTLAQSEHTTDQLEMIDTLQAALDNFADQTSYRMTGTENITQTLSANIDGTKWVVDQTFDKQIDGTVQYNPAAPLAADIEIAQVITSSGPGQPSVEVSQVMGIVIVDNSFYMRLAEVSPPELAALYPQGWVNISENPNAIPGASVINADQYIALLNSPVTYRLTAANVSAIEELPEDELDGQTLRVFELVLDLNALFESGDLERMMTAFNLSQRGVNMTDLLEQMRDKASVTLTTWVTSENTIYRIDSQIRFTSVVADLLPGMSETAINQTLLSSLVYGEFGEDFGITAPAGEA